MKYNTIVLGGGASGMFSAIFASENGEKVMLLEKNKFLGEKLKISGGGRCNIFNYEEDQKKLLSSYKEAEVFLRTSFAKFGMQNTKDFFESIGLFTKVEDRKRAFPVSEKSIDVLNVLQKELVKNKVETLCESEIEKIFFENGKVTGIRVKNRAENFVGNKYILSTGGYSHPETGSTGDGFKFLSDVGIKINLPNPSLVPLAVSDEWVKKLSGKTVENIKITFFVDRLKKKVLKLSDKQNLETKNRVLFTHFGLSGPTILNNSKFVGELLQEGEVSVQLDLFPQFDEKQLDTFLLNIFQNNLNKTLKNILNEIYAGNILEEIFLEIYADLDLHKKVHDVRVEERKKILNLLKNLKINIVGLMGFDKAIIASGGVDMNEVNFSTMQLKKIENLFVTGDMLDIERPSGGFSLQLCWTTGYVAGKNWF